MPPTTRFTETRSGEPEKAGEIVTLNTRTQQLCQILEDRMTSGDLRLSFGDYIRLLQWRNVKGYDKPHKTTVTWSDPWWLGLIGEMEDHPELGAVIADFRAKGLDMRNQERKAREMK
jgi:hypothetical protein